MISYRIGDELFIRGEREHISDTLFIEPRDGKAYCLPIMDRPDFWSILRKLEALERERLTHGWEG
jgi:hypothetical protein